MKKTLVYILSLINLLRTALHEGVQQRNRHSYLNKTDSKSFLKRICFLMPKRN